MRAVTVRGWTASPGSGSLSHARITGLPPARQVRPPGDCHRPAKHQDATRGGASRAADAVGPHRHRTWDFQQQWPCRQTASSLAKPSLTRQCPDPAVPWTLFITRRLAPRPVPLRCPHGEGRPLFPPQSCGQGLRVLKAVAARGVPRPRPHTCAHAASAPRTVRWAAAAPVPATARPGPCHLAPEAWRGLSGRGRQCT